MKGFRRGGVIDPSLDVPSIVPPSIAATTSQPPGSYATGQTGERAEPCFVPARDDGNRAAGKDGNRDGAEERQALSGQAESGKRVQSVASKGQPKLGSEGTAARSDAAALSDAAAFYRSLLDGFTQDESHADTAQVSGHAGHPAPEEFVRDQGDARDGPRSRSAPAEAGRASCYISQDNVGYKLLRAAGWREGAGLGASEQGITTPIPAWDQTGRAGIGTQGGRAARADQNKIPPGKVPVPERKEATVADRARPGGATSGGGQHGAVPAAGRRAPRSLIGTQGDQDPETMERKVKRVKQVWQAEVDAAAEAALSRYMRRAFNEPDLVTDSNPISRRNRLSDRNPLL